MVLLFYLTTYLVPRLFVFLHNIRSHEGVARILSMVSFLGETVIKPYLCTSYSIVKINRKTTSSFITVSYVLSLSPISLIVSIWKLLSAKLFIV